MDTIKVTEYVFRDARGGVHKLVAAGAEVVDTETDDGYALLTCQECGGHDVVCVGVYGSYQCAVGCMTVDPSVRLDAEDAGDPGAWE